MEKETKLTAETVKALLNEDINREDFQFVLQQLLDAWRPILEEELKLSESAERLVAVAEKQPHSCEDEQLLADRLFAPLATADVALRTLTPQAREALGPIDEWQWCLRKILCCLRFGWLLSRSRTFPVSVYYLYRYWLCIRRLFQNDPTGRQPTPEERADFRKLTAGFAEVFRPWLEQEAKAMDHSTELADGAVSGQVDCHSGGDAAEALFEKFLTVDNARLLMGAELFEKLSKDPRFWLCRCWCICAFRFGWCLGRSRSLIELVRCLVAYFRCLRRCFQPLVCELTDPTGCVAEEVNTDLKALVVAVKGTATGGGFLRYVLEWSRDGIAWHASDFHYPPIPPGGGTQGNSPVAGGLLACFDTTARDEGVYTIRLTVYGVQGTTCVRTITFSLFKQDVRILGFDGAFTLDTTAYDPAAMFVETVPALCTRPSGVHEISFGECLSIWGSAFVGGCEGRKIKRYLIDYKPGFETDPTTGGWINIWKVEYNTVWQYRDMNMRKDTSVLTASWVTDCVVPVPFPPYCLMNVPEARLAPSCWQTHVSTCGLSGLVTLRLMVEDTGGTLYYDTQKVWIDNKPICAMIRIDAVPRCADIRISSFATPPDCGVPWNLPLSGIAWDEYIDPALPLTRPNDNFDFYWVKVSKQGGTEVQIPVSWSMGSPCFFGTNRVGDPGTSCTPCDPANPLPAAVFGTLAQFDLRAIDPLCSASVGYPVPADLLLPRGECCVYVFKLRVQDRTYTPGGPHWREALWPVRICNDLKPA
ncbi:hypothetical protein [Geobacter sulfurreducens]|uniref:hypothetical protein n=1 Tax=Geobacter sulfurreducens TaxID=35554 RepID=UPI002BB9188B|nr:hypothetical protein [Geobacter sulfurreducens]HML79340.1 hypothetical protein [Geobacter sulfurreducens]